MYNVHCTNCTYLQCTVFILTVNLTFKYKLFSTINENSKIKCNVNDGE